MACVGILVADLFVPPLPDLPEAGQLLATDDFLLAPGGCAANTAICLARLGVPSSVIGKVGDDVFGDFLERDLRKRGIDTRGVSRSERYGTSKTVILPVTGQDRRFIHTFGANADLTVEDLDRSLTDAADVLYLGGYLVLPGLRQRELAELFASARRNGTRTVLDVVVPAGDTAASLDRLEDLLPHVDFFLPNEDEAQALTGETELDRQAARLLEAGAQGVVVTMGPQGVRMVSGGQTLRLPAPRVDVVDQSGAGDAFAAGFIVGLLEGWSMDKCLRFASVIGASACTKLGCTSGVFTRSQAESYLEAHPLEVFVDAAPR